jgi:hypothetical protein
MLYLVGTEADNDRRHLQLGDDGPVDQTDDAGTKDSGGELVTGAVPIGRFREPPAIGSSYLKAEGNLLVNGLGLFVSSVLNRMNLISCEQTYPCRR